MRRGELILAAPARCTGDFAEASDAFIGMHLHQQERRDRMGSAFGTNGEALVNRHAYRDGLDRGNYHVRRSSRKAATSRTMASKKRCPFSAFARSGCPTTPLSEISWNSFTAYTGFAYCISAWR